MNAKQRFVKQIATQLANGDGAELTRLSHDLSRLSFLTLRALNRVLTPTFVEKPETDAAAAQG